jgi:hypothetical protein
LLGDVSALPNITALADFVPAFKILHELGSVFVDALDLPLVWLREIVALFGVGAPRVDPLLADWIVLATEVAEGGLAALELLIGHYALKIGVDDITWLVLLTDSPDLSFYREDVHHIICEGLKPLHNRRIT